MISDDNLKKRIQNHLIQIYGDIHSNDEIYRIADNLTSFLSEQYKLLERKKSIDDFNRWSEKSILLITYGDTIYGENKSSLRTLFNFLQKNCKKNFSIIHILPFFPSSSDHGFSVINYYNVEEKYGDWKDIKNISGNFDVMCDVVLNHGSVKSEWFQNFINGNGDGANYFYTTNAEIDTSKVVRPRTNKLLSKVKTVNGEKYVWCTFSEDQVDYNFSNFEVIKEFIKIISFYISNGVNVFRFDAVAFIWKKIGSNCINLPETHEIVRLFRTVLDYLSPKSILVTETNTPARENVTYFGNANEAHWIYNFSLPPILIYSILKGDSSILKKLTMTMPPAQLGTSYLNFIASHDGIGLRPAEGILTKKQTESLVRLMEKNGGQTSYRVASNNESKPYEMNISLFDAMKATFKENDEFVFQRFICIHTIMLSLEGVPAFYIHSMFGTKNDQELYKKTQHNRDLNRHSYKEQEVYDFLEDECDYRSKIFKQINILIEIRRKQLAFHPNAVQFTLHLGKHFYGIWRQSLDKKQSIFCISNLTNKDRKLSLIEINLIGFEEWKDLISDKIINDIDAEIVLKPYQTLWISNQF